MSGNRTAWKNRDCHKGRIKKNTMRIKIRYFLLPVLAMIFGYMLYSTYREVRNQTIAEFNIQQMILAKQAAKGIQNFFNNYYRDLNYLAQISNIIRFDDQGKALMQAYHTANSSEIRAITRVDADGRIVYTVPYRPQAIGVDISQQDHLRVIMRTHKPVVSDVFTAIQGYRVVAYHVPVFADTEYRGSIAVLIPFESLAKQYLENIRIGNSGYAWMISQKGMELYFPLPGHTGKPIDKAFGNFPSVLSMAREMMKGKAGITTYAFPGKDGERNETITHHAVYYPIRLGNTFWSIAVATPERDVLATMRGFRNRLFFIVTILLAIGVFYAYYVIRALAILVEEKERKKAEEALRKSEEKYRQLSDLLPQIVFEMDENGRLTFVNRIAFDIMGYTETDFEKGLHALDMIAPEDRDMAWENVLKILNGENLGGIEYKLLKNNGDVFPGLVYGSAIISDGKAKGLRGIVADLTEIRAAEAALESEEQRFRALVEESPLGVALISKKGRYKYINPKFIELFGYNLADISTGRAWFKKAFPDPQYREKVISAWFDTISASKDGKSRVHTFTVTCKDGAQKLIHFKSVTIGSGDELVTYEDITEKKRLEEQFQQAQRMEAIGTLAGGIAHDFNNLLMGIQGRTSMMLSDAGVASPYYEHLKGIEDYVRSATDLTRQLLGFARGGRYQVKLTNLNELIKRQNRMFGRTKKEIRIRGKYDNDLWDVAVDQGQMEQVLLNIYVNAWQAMPGGGELRIQTENVTLDAGVTRPFEVKPGRYIKISVTDTGVGMDEATRQRIFDPFFTTKEMGRGTGLGLASVYGIIKNHDGFLDVFSEKGKGSTFVIYLPASPADRRRAEPEREKPEDDIVRGSGTVLLVDDEEMILKVAGQMLQRLGYNVMTVNSGHDALEIYEKNQSEIDIVILDMIMPGMGGGETHDQLKTINPCIKVLLSSGYSLNGKASEILMRGCDGFIQKPFNLNDLSHKIKEILQEQ